MNTQVLPRFVHSPHLRQKTVAVPAEYRKVTAAAVEPVPIDTPAPQPEVSSGGTQGVRHVAVLRAGLLVGCLASTGIAWTAAYGSSHTTEPELAVLLRGMAAIKTLLAVLGAGLVYWRFGLPISARAALAYAAGVGLMLMACTLIWHLTFIPLAAALFHAGGMGALLVAWREGRQAPRAKWRTRNA